jgi:hypothetical protein
VKKRPRLGQAILHIGTSSYRRRYVSMSTTGSFVVLAVIGLAVGAVIGFSMADCSQRRRWLKWSWADAGKSPRLILRCPRRERDLAED